MSHCTRFADVQCVIREALGLDVVEFEQLQARLRGLAASATEAAADG